MQQQTRQMMMLKLEGVINEAGRGQPRKVVAPRQASVVRLREPRHARMMAHKYTKTVLMITWILRGCHATSQW